MKNLVAGCPGRASDWGSGGTAGTARVEALGRAEPSYQVHPNLVPPCPALPSPSQPPGLDVKTFSGNS